MIREAIAKIEEMARQATEPAELKLAGESRAVARVVHADGKIELVTKVPPLRFIELYTLADVIALATKPLDEAWERRAVFFNANDITIVFDFRNGYELAKLRLPATSEVMYLLERMKAPAQKVAEIVLAFQTVMRRTRPEADMEAFIEAVGRLAVSGGNQAAEEAARGRAGISKAIQQQVAEPERLPAELQGFDVRPFAVPDIKYRSPVLCTLLPRVADVVWQLQPVQDSWLEFQEESLSYLRTRLVNEAKDVPAYCGRWDVQA